QAEDYDTGGEGVSYHDLSQGNIGGVYRIDDVDIESCSEGGYNISFVQTDEWMKYTVNVSTSGTYDIKCRVATIHPDSQFKIYFDDIDKTGAILVPNTGGWQTWQTVTVTDVYLEAGKQIMKVYDLGGEYNLNYIEIVSK
ncbi:MAG: carbohydrate-binding protein, partial [Spirochaetes bacterium]|nr:carbohydrate-binding protein [Spirochaetota bacterium]